MRNTTRSLESETCVLTFERILWTKTHKLCDGIPISALALGVKYARERPSRRVLGRIGWAGWEERTLETAIAEPGGSVSGMARTLARDVGILIQRVSDEMSTCPLYL